jgi:hypothetical protein
VTSACLPGWQASSGISGSFAVEWVAGFAWNQWQAWSGIRTGGVMLGRLSAQLQRVENGVELIKVILDGMTRLHVALDILRSQRLVDVFDLTEQWVPMVFWVSD